MTHSTQTSTTQPDGSPAPKGKLWLAGHEVRFTRGQTELLGYLLPRQSAHVETLCYDLGISRRAFDIAVHRLRKQLSAITKTWPKRLLIVLDGNGVATAKWVSASNHHIFQSVGVPVSATTLPLR